MRRSRPLSIGIRFAAIVFAVAACCLLASGCATKTEEREQYEAGVEHYDGVTADLSWVWGIFSKSPEKALILTCV